MPVNLFDHLLNALRRPPTTSRRFQFDELLVERLRQIAQREQRSEQDVAADLLEEALTLRGTDRVRLQVWESLSPREQEVVALACLGKTNRQIAARLYLSTETIKTHMRHSLRKFGVANRAELRTLLADWDFGGWK
jgi:DNA-binding NarL/FixJ family response regulator